MTIQELALMSDAYRTPASMASKYAYDIRAGNPQWRQRLLGTQATTGQELLNKRLLAQNMTRDLREKGDLQHVDEQLNFLRSMANQPKLNLYRAPMNERDAALQGAVQEDINARTRGFDAGYKADEFNRKRAIEDFGLSLKMQDQGMQRANLNRSIQNDARDFGLARAREQRLRDTTAQSLAMEKAALGQRAGDTAYRTAIDMVERGVPLKDIFETVPGLNSLQRERLASILGEYDTQAMEEYGLLSGISGVRTNQLQEAEEAARQKAMESYLSQNDGFLGFGAGAETDPEAMAMQETQAERARRQFLDSLNDKNIYFDPNTSQFQPLVPKPRLRASLPVTSQTARGPATSGLPLMRSSAEAMRLPSGTPFRTPDGRTLIRP